MCSGDQHLRGGDEFDKQSIRFYLPEISPPGVGVSGPGLYLLKSAVLNPSASGEMLGPQLLGAE